MDIELGWFVGALIEELLLSFVRLIIRFFFS